MKKVRVLGIKNNVCRWRMEKSRRDYFALRERNLLFLEVMIANQKRCFQHIYKTCFLVFVKNFRHTIMPTPHTCFFFLYMVVYC